MQELMNTTVDSTTMPVPEPKMWGVRLNFTNGQSLKFEFADGGNPHAVAQEINDFLQMKVEILGIKDEAGKRYFKSSDVLPKRKCTIDIVFDNTLVRGAMTGVPCFPAQIFKNEGKFFAQLIGVILTQSAKMQNKLMKAV